MQVTRKKNKRIHERSRRAKKYKARGGSNSWGEDCKYVSSRAIMKSCKIHSPNPVSSNIIIDDIDFTQLVDGCTVYITGSAIPSFVNKLNTLPCKIILVSGDCDETIPEAVFPTDEAFKSFIESDKIIHWFSQNCVGKHPKLSGIPIGLNYHTKIDTTLSPIEQETELNQVKTDAKPLLERIVKCYSNFHFSKNKTYRYTYNRDDAIEKIPTDLIFYEPSRINLKKTYINQSKYAFIVSPHGNGLDCHRTWEALCLGSIPIVKTSPIDYLYSELPVLIVKEWGDVTKSLLESTLAEFKDKKFNYDKLTLKYWVDKINSANVKIGGSSNSKKHYHIYNAFHYGDNIFNLKFFFGLTDILKQHNIIIHYYYNPIYIKNVDELTRYVNSEVVILDTLDKKPNDAYVMWMRNYDAPNIEPAINSMYKDVLKHLRLENLQIDTSIYQKEDYLLDIYNKLDPKFKDINILILNAEPKSGQFSYNKEKMDNMCRHLASKFKVVVISPVDNIPCTLTDGLKLQDIGAISTHAEYIIGFNSGPLIPCFNIHTKNKVKKWIIFDKVGTIIKEVNAVLLPNEANVNVVNTQINSLQKGGFNNKRSRRYKKHKGGNQPSKRAVVYILSSTGGFFSQYSSLWRVYLYAKKINAPFFIEHNNWQYTYKDGWHDYFKTLKVFNNNDGFDSVERFNNNIMNDIISQFTVREYIDAMKETFILNDTLQNFIDSYIKKIGGNYTSLYVRRGDKINEIELISIDKILEQTTIKDDGSTIFIQTDDYSVIKDIKTRFPTCKIMSLTKESANGSNNQHMINWTPEQIKEETEELLCACVISAKANTGWVYNMSNVGVFIKLLGYENIHIYKDDKYSKEEVDNTFNLDHKWPPGIL